MQKDYDEFRNDSFNNRAKKTTSIEHKTAKKQDESQVELDDHIIECKEYQEMSFLFVFSVAVEYGLLAVPFAPV